MLADNENAVDFVGQKSLLRRISGMRTETLPRSLILVGSSGCGKHTFCKLLASRFDLDLRETGEVSIETLIDTASTTGLSLLYMVNLDNCSTKEQNSLLKILEEPLSNVFIVCMCSSINKVLPTLYNRCQCWYFEHYSKQELSLFAKSDEDVDFLTSLFDTPGQIIHWQNHNLRELWNLADTIFEKIGKASISNIMTLLGKIDCGGKKIGGYPLDLLTHIMKKVILFKIENSDNPYYLKVFNTVIRLEDKLNLSISKERTVCEFLLQLRSYSNC